MDRPRHTERVRRCDEYADNTNTSPASCYHLAYGVEDIKEPSNFRDALDNAQAERWKSAADSEYKSLYGLKQTPLCWNKVFRKHLEGNGFTQTSSDACVYVKSIKETLIVIVVYVDDLIILAETAEEMAKIKETLSTKFKMKDMKELHYCLGITIVHDRVKQKVWLNQCQYRTLNPGNSNCQGKLKLL